MVKYKCFLNQTYTTRRVRILFVHHRKIDKICITHTAAMKYFYSIMFILFLGACDKPEIGAIDNETISRKLFDTMRDNDPGKALDLLPDKGTYRKIMKEWKGEEVPESAYDSLIMRSESDFILIRKMLPDWSNTKYSNTHTQLMKEGILQVAKTTTKFELNGEFYKYRFTTCKFNGRWFSLGDIVWTSKE